MDFTKITLNIEIPRTGLDWLDAQLRDEHGPRTLASAFAELKRNKASKLFTEGDFERGYQERVAGLLRAIESGRPPTIGQVITAGHYAANEKVLADQIAADSPVTTRQFDARRGGITRQVIHHDFPDRES